MSEDLNCLSYWFPRLQAAGLPVPHTEIVDAGGDWGQLLNLWEHNPERLEPARAVLDRVVDGVRLVADVVGDYPLFLRTGQGSGKHHWKRCCYVPDAASVPDHVAALVEWSQMVDFLGLSCRFWAVRELLPTTPIGYCAGYDGMPVCKEFRFFVRDGEVWCYHPYWPWASLEQGGFAGDVSPGWYEGLCRLPEPHGPLFDLVRRAGQAMGGGFWSVDLLETRRGWFVTDMALGERSFHWPECPHIPGAIP